MAASETPWSSWRSALVARERRSVSVHRDTLRGTALPPPRASGAATFLHGFLLPFSLVLATLRHPTLGLPYVRITVVRVLIVGVLAAVAFTLPRVAEGGREALGLKMHVRLRGAEHAKSAHPVAEGLRGAAHDAARSGEDPRVARSLAQAADTVEKSERAQPPDAKPAIVRALEARWRWLVWFFGVMSGCQALIVFLSRRWDDWLSFCASSAVARIKPEEAVAPTPRVAIEARWIVKKLRRRLRGYVLLASGVPLLLALQLFPSIGDALFATGLTIWSGYWLAVFTAAKSAHAWADDGVAPSPVLVRELRDRSAGHRFLRPVHAYARLWARICGSVNAAVATFERTPSPFLGLALARLVLSLPGLYLLARPIVPVAAGRLCAENDPQDRFSLPS